MFVYLTTVCERERERERVLITGCLCVRERERARARERERTLTPKAVNSGERGRHPTHPVSGHPVSFTDP